MVREAGTSYRKGVVGGTFDIFHAGHKKLLKTALINVDALLIGITSDRFAALSRGREVNPFEKRVRKVLDFIRTLDKEDKVEIRKIEDPFGPSVEDQELEVLFVTENLLFNALKVNSLRQPKGMKPLDIFVVPLLRAENGGILSSTRIRTKKINENGTIAH